MQRQERAEPKKVAPPFNRDDRAQTNPNPVNHNIRASAVRLIGEDGQQSILPTNEALRQAYALGMDLLQVAIDQDGYPVCRILDADRWRYEQARLKREQAKRQRTLAVVVKEVQLRPVTDIADLRVKARRAKEFLTEGDKVKVVVRFRGRERTHREEGRRIIESFLTEIGSGQHHKVESGPLDGDRDIMMVLAPLVSKAEALRATETLKRGAR